MNKEIEVLQLIDEQANPINFIIKRIENIYDQLNGITDNPHRHAYYTIILVESGEGTHTIDFKQFKVEDKTLHVIYPGQVHSFVTKSRPKGWVFNFTSSFIVKNSISNELVNRVYLHNTYGDTPPLYLDNEIFKKFDTVAQDINSHFESPSTYYLDAIGALLKLFFIKSTHICSLQSVADIHQSPNERNLLTDFKLLIESDFNKTHKVGDFANKLAVSSDYLNKFVKNQIGKSAKELIQDKLLIEAKRMLIFSNKSNKELAFDLGFEEPAHFNNFFKKYSQVTPKQFKLKNSL